MKTNLCLVALGGSIGSVLRYLASFFVSRHFTSFSFPYGTFAVNVAGCLIIGILYGITDRFQWLSPSMRFFLITGFCGGFTTFSAFAYENMQFLQQSNFLLFTVYTVSSFTICIGAVFAGFLVVKYV